MRYIIVESSDIIKIAELCSICVFNVANTTQSVILIDLTGVFPNNSIFQFAGLFALHEYHMVFHVVKKGQEARSPTYS